MEVKFRQRFEKDIDNITNQGVLDSIAKVVESAIKAKKPQDIVNIKKIKGNKTAFRIRIGTFRIGIYIVNGTIEFTRVLPRATIYKFFPK